jgi:transposase-like protein
MDKLPKTLLEVIQYFASEDNCIKFLAAKRWPDGKPVCPHCGDTRVSFLAKQRRFQCAVHHPKRQFSIKVGTIFEDSPLALDKWLPAMWLIGSNRNGISSWELHRALGVTQKTAWFMLHRIRTAMQDETHGGKIGGNSEPVQIDETFIGGKARNMHAKKRTEKCITQGGGKTVVLGALDRGGKVRATVASDCKRKTIAPFVREHVEAGSTIHTDEWQTAWWNKEEYVHEVVNHLEGCVNGNVTTNGIENFWALLKRQITGTYVSVEPFHLFRYVDEEAFRYNNRLPMSDGDRFNYLVRKIVGKRLTYAQLTGKEEGAEAF